MRSRSFFAVLSLSFGLLLGPSSFNVVKAAPAKAGKRVRKSGLRAAIAGDHRSPENKARDVYRKPLQTLQFLGFRSNMTVLEIWPGAGWYTQILAPALKDRGKLIVAQFDPNGPYGFQRRYYGEFLKMAGEKPDIYRDVKITTLDFPYKLQVAPKESVDMVLTFRNVHNWVMPLMGGGQHTHLAFQAMYDALKPGGILGVVDHAWPDDKPEDPQSKNGYISVRRTVQMAEQAGFVLVKQSNLLNNPKDTKDHPQGVWSLPPTYAAGEQDKGKYAAIGESDRFLLKFVKPKKPKKSGKPKKSKSTKASKKKKSQ